MTKVKSPFDTGTVVIVTRSTKGIGRVMALGVGPRASVVVNSRH